MTWLKSALALLAGMIVVVALSIGADMAVNLTRPADL